MGFRPLRRAPMMLGGVGFQSGLDEARRARAVAPQTGVGGDVPGEADVIEQLQELKALLDEGVLTPDEFQIAKRKVLERGITADRKTAPNGT